MADLLVDNIRGELTAASALNDLSLDDVVIGRLANAVAANVLYAFSVDWSPDWIKPGEIHAWEEASEWFARCSTCLADSPPEPDRETAIRWAADHTARHQHRHK